MPIRPLRSQLRRSQGSDASEYALQSPTPHAHAVSTMHGGHFDYDHIVKPQPGGGVVAGPGVDDVWPPAPGHTAHDTLGLGLAVKDMIAPPYDAKANTSVWQVSVAAALGIGLGTVLTHFEVRGDYAAWLALPGDLFINALKCLIMPMVFCSVVVVIGELVEAGKAVSIGGRTVAYFSVCSLLSSSIGVVAGYLFSDLFTVQVKPLVETPTARLLMKCGGERGGVLAMTNAATGALACLAQNATNGASLFAVADSTSYFAVKGIQTTYAALSVSDQIFSIVNDLVPDNIVAAFAETSTLSIITFALCFGIALAKVVDRAKEGDNYPLLLIGHANVICRMLINKVVAVIPLAIVSMIAGSMAQFSKSAVVGEETANAVSILQSVGWLVLALGVALAFLTLGVLGLALFVTTRRNIFSYLKSIVPAQVFIFGCSSSLATLPITLRCVESAKEVSPALARFVLPLGATCNLNGSALYMTLTCVFMAKVGGYEDRLTPITGVLLAIVGAIASFGVAPVPHSGLVMVITVWRTVFNMDVPPVFSVLVGMDWILNRMRAIVNITNDTIICRIVAEQCDETTAIELDRLGEGAGTVSPMSSR